METVKNFIENANHGKENKTNQASKCKTKI